MKKYLSFLGVAAKIWVLTALMVTTTLIVILNIQSIDFPIAIIPVIWVSTTLASIPALILICIGMAIISPKKIDIQLKIWLVFVAAFIAVLPYSMVASLAGLNIFSVPLFAGYKHPMENLIPNTGFLFGNAIVAICICLKTIVNVFIRNAKPADINPCQQDQQESIHHLHLKTNTMEQQQLPQSISNPNKILIKGLVIGFLTLVLLIPTIFISNLITEREERQKEVVKEVSSKWSKAQKLAGPFISIPYKDSFINSDNQVQTLLTQIIVVANNVKVDAEILPEQRPRSIYKVLLYSTEIAMQGQYKFHFPVDIKTENLDLKNAKICFALSDFKGIEQEMNLIFNKQKLVLSPGLPTVKLGDIGLSASIDLSAITPDEFLDFNMQLKLKGSEQLHFVPLALSSNFNMKSSWTNPSFDGEVLPSERTVNNDGFMANWKFNQANLPFTDIQKEGNFTTNNFQFGVSLVQPADQYNKTMRSVKYAILIIGLSFTCFFITELLQKKPFHAIQYVLVGFALVIFYSLLLSISEYLTFSKAYLIAAFATIALIAIYVNGQFKNYKTTAVFVSILSILYGFIYVLISLEDTALLVGSIGLFLILALIMALSKRINWYGNNKIIHTQD